MSVVGVDLGINKVALVYSDGQDQHFASIHAPESRKSRPRILRELASYVYDTCSLHRPDSVWIEDTLIGNNRMYSIKLAETKGAVMAALAGIPGLDVQLVNVSTWKKEIVGNGKADKDAVRNHIRETHGAYAPLCGEDQDLYDATCVALYGLRIIERAKHLHLQP